MPIEFSVDEAARIVRMRCVDPIKPEDVFGTLERQIREGYWHYGTIVDARHSGLDAAQSTALFDKVSGLVATHGPNGPVALVTRTPAHVGGAQLIAMRSGRLAMQFEVFWDMRDAEQWLSDRLAGSGL